MLVFASVWGHLYTSLLKSAAPLKESGRKKVATLAPPGAYRRTLADEIVIDNGFAKLESKLLKIFL